MARCTGCSQPLEAHDEYGLCSRCYLFPKQNDAASKAAESSASDSTVETPMQSTSDGKPSPTHKAPAALARHEPPRTAEDEWGSDDQADAGPLSSLRTSPSAGKGGKGAGRGAARYGDPWSPHPQADAGMKGGKGGKWNRENDPWEVGSAASWATPTWGGKGAPPHEAAPHRDSWPEGPCGDSKDKTIAELRMQIAQLEERLVAQGPAASGNDTQPRTSCKWCRMDTYEHKFCRRTGQKHISVDVAKKRMEKVKEEHRFPDEIAKRYARINDVRHVVAYADVLNVPEGVVQNARHWLKLMYIRLVRPDGSAKANALEKGLGQDESFRFEAYVPRRR